LRAAIVPREAGHRIIAAMAAGKSSAGLLMYRRAPHGLEVFLVHPGGPFFARRDAGAWTIPKGEVGVDEDPHAVARREFAEETGRATADCATGEGYVDLGAVRQRGGKLVRAWAFEGDWPPGLALRSNTFSMEWPRGSGRAAEFPEVDRGGFFRVDEALRKINPAQTELIERLLERLATRDGGCDPAPL
jgi:predicted NUDIX family NTP pyrophosphohydrolase